ncbi:Rho GTPase activation protein [Pseudocohnilembus persalinus]|uniref:Rho GTPase activation protein n=1 Tax=Pseudocohnilembus persalinus TaxID=266149 RepID=A0A0V0QM70_PSEPJ|nr:Rho GTPase activation protein [Pseudocohnilembus persalinus]|eukprot:KRX03212.1 Rho GTPase activation protein [Pseudocohnilembus persalinus]
MEMQEELNASEQKETIQIQEKNQEKENKQEEQIELDKEQFIKNEKEYSENRESNNSQENKIKFGNENFDFDIQLKLRKVDSDEFMISPLKGEKLKQKQQQNQEKRRKLRKFSNAVEEIKEREKNKESEENSMNRSQQDLPKYAEKQREKEKKLQKLEISEQDFLLASSQQEYSFQNQFNNQFIQPCIENEIIPDTQIKEEMEDLEEDFDNSDEDSELISKDSLLLDQNDIVIYDSDSEEDQENSSKILKRQDNIQRGNQQEVIVEQEEDFQQQEIQIENQNKEQEQDQNEIQKQENQHINLYDDQKENQQTDQPSNLQGNQEQQKNDGEIVIDNLEQLKEYQKNKEVGALQNRRRNVSRMKNLDIKGEFKLQYWVELQQKLKQEVNLVEKETEFKDEIMKELKRLNTSYYTNYIELINLEDGVKYDEELKQIDPKHIYEEGQKLFRTDPKAYKASISSWQKQNKKQQQQQFRQKKYSESLMYDQEAQLQKPQIEKYEDMMKNMQKKDILNMIEKNQEAQIAQMPGKKTLNQIKISDSFLQQQQQNQQLQQRSESVTLETLGKILDQQENGSVSSTYRQSNPVFQSQQLQQQNSQLLMEEKDSVQSSQNTLFQSQNLKKYLSQQQELENRNQQHNQKQQQQQQQLSINNSMVLKKGNYFLQKSGNNNSNFILNNNNNGNSSSLQRQKSEIYQDLYVQSQLEKRSKKLEQLVHIVMQSIFDHMHNFPNGIKIVLKMVKMLILKKFQDSDSNSINQIFANYIFDIWILPQLQFPQLYIDLKLIKAVHNVNLMESSFTDENYSRYNVIIEQYMESVDKYYEEISNVNEKLIEEIFQKSELIENQIFEKLQTQTICLSVENIQNLINMVYSCKEELGEKFGENGNKLGILEIIKQLHKQCQDKDLKLFESKKNLDSKNVNRVFLPGEIFVLFQNFRLPNEYRLNDYRQLYEELRENLRERMENFKDITQKIKVMVLRAKQCLQKKLTINQKIMDRFKQEISRREIEEQQSCIHSLVNTKFLNSLAGNLQENDPTKNSHFNSIKEFIKIFSELPEVKNLIKNGDDKFKVNENFNEFISALMDLIKEDEQFEQMQSKDLIWLQDNLEQYITKQIYDKLFPKKSTVKDLSLCIRLQTLDWISYDHLEIDEFNREDSMWEKAAQSLNNIENCRTPTEKLEALQECTNNMADILKLTSKKEEAVGADITTPCMIYILLKAKPQKLPSNLYFINAFANSQSMRTASGFCFTQIRSVMGFLENLQASQLKNISQLQFDRNTYERECQLEISFLKKRPREGRRKIRFDLVKKVQNEQLEIISFKRNSINSQNSQQGQLESQYNLNANNDVQNIKIEDKNINKNENENQKEQIQNNQLEQQKKKENNEKIQEEVNNRNRQKSSALFQRRISQNLNFLNGNLASSEIVSKNQENAKKLLGIEENYNSENEIFSQSQKMQISELIKEKNAQTSNIY